MDSILCELKGGTALFVMKGVRSAISYSHSSLCVGPKLGQNTPLIVILGRPDPDRQRHPEVLRKGHRMRLIKSTDRIQSSRRRRVAAQQQLVMTKCLAQAIKILSGKSVD